MVRTLDDVTDMLSKRGWRLYNEDGKPKRTRRRSTYERAVEDLEANTNQVKTSFQQNTDKPRRLLKRIIDIQNHLDERFRSKRGGVQGATYSVKQYTLPILSKFLLGNRDGASLYNKTDVQVIVEQRSLTTLLLDEFDSSQKEMRKSYDLLEEYRRDTTRALQGELSTYKRLVGQLGKLERDETSINTKIGTTTADDDMYAELFHAAGNVKLERQRLVNEHEQAASAIRNCMIGQEEIRDYQMVIRESEQVLGDAALSLTQVAEQQATAQAVLSAFVEGQSSMAAAYKVMETLSTDIVTTHRTITGAFESLNSLAMQLSTGRTTANTTAEASRGLYGNLRGSRRQQVDDVHAYVKQLFEKPTEFSSNGHQKTEMLEV